MAVLLQHMLCICPMHSMTLQGNKDPEVDKYKNVYVVQMDEIVHRYVRLQGPTAEFRWREHTWFILARSSFEEAVNSLIDRVRKDHVAMTLHHHDEFPFTQGNQNPARSSVLCRVEPASVRGWAPKVTLSDYMTMNDYRPVVEKLVREIPNCSIENTGVVIPVF